MKAIIKSILVLSFLIFSTSSFANSRSCPTFQVSIPVTAEGYTIFAGFEERARKDAQENARDAAFLKAQEVLNDNPDMFVCPPGCDGPPARIDKSIYGAVGEYETETEQDSDYNSFDEETLIELCVKSRSSQNDVDANGQIFPLWTVEENEVWCENYVGGRGGFLYHQGSAWIGMSTFNGYVSAYKECGE